MKKNPKINNRIYTVIRKRRVPATWIPCSRTIKVVPTYDDSTELSVKSMSLSLRISFFFFGSLTTEIWMPPDPDPDSGPKVAPPDPPLTLEEDEMVTSS